jgi:hypothetical protein
MFSRRHSRRFQRSDLCLDIVARGCSGHCGELKLSHASTLRPRTKAALDYLVGARASTADRHDAMVAAVLADLYSVRGLTVWIRKDLRCR